MSGIERKLWWRREFHFILGALLYILANFFDYYITLWGIKITSLPEGNPFLRFCMEILGTRQGLFIPKIVLVCFVIIAIRLTLSLAKKLPYRKNLLFKRITFATLYGSAIVTVLAGFSWLLILI